MRAQHLENVARAVIQLFKANVCENVQMVPDADLAEIASLPVVLLPVPRLVEVTEEIRKRVVEKNLTVNRATVKKPDRFYDLTWDVELLAESPLGYDGLFQLIQRTADMWANNPALVVPITDASGAVVDVDEYEIDHSAELVPMPGEILAARGSFVVRRVALPDGDTPQVVPLVLERIFDIQPYNREGE